MAAPTYATDLTTFNNCTSTTGWVEMNGMAVGGGADLDTDLGIYGDRCISELIRKTGLASLAYNNGSGVTIGTDEGFFVWSKYQAPNGVSTRATNGIGVVIGSSTSNWGRYSMDGSDTYPYGGWTNYFVDPTTNEDASNGTYGTTYQYCGTFIDVTNAVSKGNPQSIDIIRYGRGESRFTNGDLANGYATFDGFAVFNDNPTTGRYGLLQDQGGSYLWKGLMSLGLSGTSVDFRDANVNITIDDTIKAGDSFNRIEIHNAGSTVHWTAINMTKVGSTSRGEFEMIDNASVILDTCVFTDMSTFIFDSNATVDTCTFRRTDKITQNSADFDRCIIEGNISAAAILSDDPSAISNCTFFNETNHAIEIDTAGTYSFDANSFNNYLGTPGSNGTASSGSTEAAIYNNSGGYVVINITGGGDTPSIRNGAGATTQVNNNVSITFTGLRDDTEVRIMEAGSETVELAGIEDVTDGTFDNRSFTWSVASGTTVDYRIGNIVYEIIEVYGFIPTADAVIPIQQRFDRSYLNN